MPFGAILGGIGKVLLGAGIKKAAAGAIGSAVFTGAAKKIKELRGPTAPSFSGLPAAGISQAGMFSPLKSFGPMSRVIPAVGRVGGAVIGAGRAAIGATRRFLNTPGGKWTKKAIRDLGLVVVGGLVYDAAGNLMGTVQRRRMNPMNGRALRRAVRRVKSAKKLCNEVNKLAPGPSRRRSGGSRGVNVSCH